jgi:hypothetical protein
MAFLREGAVKDLVTRGPKLEDVVTWAEDFVVDDDVVPSPSSISDYIRGHGLSHEEFVTLVNILLGEAEDPHSEDVLMKLLAELENREIKEAYQNKRNIMEESIKMPRLLKEDYHKECSDEVKMAKIQLKSIMDDAGTILQGLDQCEELDAWVQTKLALAEDYLTTVAKYMKFEEEEPAEELPLVPAVGEVPPEGPEMVAPMDMEVDVEEGPDETDLIAFSKPKEELEDELEDEELEDELEDEELEDEELEDEELEDELLGEGETMYPTVAYMRDLSEPESDIYDEDEYDEEEIEEYGMYEGIKMPRLRSL